MDTTQVFAGLAPLTDDALADGVLDGDVLDIYRQFAVDELEERRGTPAGAVHALLVSRDRLARSRWKEYRVYPASCRWFVLTLVRAHPPN